ncbi:phosphatidylinositol-glycan biosynthesis class F protein-like [Anneissia japonica]|uniref:phosphatidylinositol-glycan biosynthesis class F protein-like n=1 Tax=Anneissia japonica TaxID=1529436 RepID=UPI00142579EF|nr:phosphatidylinositol-glycan biosynthesis class F protein-like [Anneissia japonica]XP_033104705.1 phosphatidylinositol-glycan biosynthesis class F protein-like [Anneissia japonica]
MGPYSGDYDRNRGGKNSLISASNLLLIIFTSTVAFCIVYLSPDLHFGTTSLVYKPLWTIKTLSFTWAGFQFVLFTLVKLRSPGKGNDISNACGLIHKARKSLLMELRNLILLFLLYAASCIAFHVISILFGAYIFENFEETFLFSVLVSTLVSLPCLLVNELDYEAWNRFISGCCLPGVESYVMTVACCSLLGAWVGAVPIPLDWDRPWQVWPISCSIGVVIGHGTGLLLCTAHAGFNVLQQFRRGKSKLF